MPYIESENREGAKILPTNVGELSYNLANTIIEYLDTKKESYQTYNDIIGVLECMKMELYRRMIVPYEDKKRKENGDVF